VTRIYRLLIVSYLILSSTSETFTTVVSANLKADARFDVVPWVNKWLNAAIKCQDSVLFPFNHLTPPTTASSELVKSVFIFSVFPPFNFNEKRAIRLSVRPSRGNWFWFEQAFLQAKECSVKVWSEYFPLSTMNCWSTFHSSEYLPVPIRIICYRTAK
jgi:hypothetical protein